MYILYIHIHHVEIEFLEYMARSFHTVIVIAKSPSQEFLVKNLMILSPYPYKHCVIKLFDNRKSDT